MDLTQLAAQLAKLGAPILGTALGGPLGGALANTIIGALADALGTAPTPEAVGKAIETKPGASSIVRQVEAEQAPAVLDELNARLKDVQDARAATVKLAEQGSAIAWGAPVVSAFVLGTFAVTMVWVVTHGVPSGAEGSLVTGLVETLKVMSVAVVSYWVGSSAGSKEKDATVASLAKAKR